MIFSFLKNCDDIETKMKNQPVVDTCWVPLTWASDEKCIQF